MLKQLSIYAENKKGVMQNITGILKDEDIMEVRSCLKSRGYTVL